MKTDHQDLQRASGGKLVRALTEKAHEFVVYDFYDLLARGNALKHLLADAGGLDAVDEFTGDLKVDVG